MNNSLNLQNKQQERSMREAFSNPHQALAKKNPSKQQTAQLSQRSNQIAPPSAIAPQHQKTQSLTGTKGLSGPHQLITAYEEQTLQDRPKIYQINPQSQFNPTSAQFSQLNSMTNNQKQTQLLHQQQLISSQVQSKQTHQINSGIGGAVHHKKANSLMNSKMAQLLLKGVVNNGPIPNTTHQNQAVNNSLNMGTVGHPQMVLSQGTMPQQIQSTYKNSNQQNITNLTSSIGSQIPISNQVSFVNNEVLNFNEFENLQDHEDM